MSSNQTFSSSSSYSFSSSSSSSNNNGQVSGTRSTQQSYTGPDGQTHVRTTNQNLGEPTIEESRSYDAQGRQVVGDSGSRRVENTSDQEQARRDAEYEERIEEEYAKREGGA